MKEKILLHDVNSHYFLKIASFVWLKYLAFVKVNRFSNIVLTFDCKVLRVNKTDFFFQFVLYKVS